MNSEPLILGHRGGSAVAPENTLAAFSRAMLDGADGFEFDVRLSRDGIPVVIHDADLKRTGSKDNMVGELTAAELQTIDVGLWFARRASQGDESHYTSYAGERLPTLAQVMELFKQTDGLLYVEMKCDVPDGATLAAEVVRLTREHDLVDRVVLESFDLSAVAAVKKVDAKVRTAALFEPKVAHPLATLRRLRMISLARECGADEIALHHTLASSRAIDAARKSGLEVVVWTVDDPKWISRARTLGIKALIANNPALLVQHRSAGR